MAETVRRVQYCDIEVPDKPGEGAKVLNLLKDTDMNLLACGEFVSDWRVSGCSAALLTKASDQHTPLACARCGQQAR